MSAPAFSSFVSRGTGVGRDQDVVVVPANTNTSPAQPPPILSTTDVRQAVAAWIANPATSTEDIDDFLVEHARQARARRGRGGRGT